MATLTAANAHLLLAVDNSEVLELKISKKQLAAIKSTSNQSIGVAKQLRDSPMMSPKQRTMLQQLFNHLEAFSVCLHIVANADGLMQEKCSNIVDATGLCDLSGVVNRYAPHVEPFPNNPECYKTHGPIQGFLGGETFSATGSNMDDQIQDVYPPEEEVPELDGEPVEWFFGDGLPYYDVTW